MVLSLLLLFATKFLSYFLSFISSFVLFFQLSFNIYLVQAFYPIFCVIFSIYPVLCKSPFAFTLPFLCPFFNGMQSFHVYCIPGSTAICRDMTDQHRLSLDSQWRDLKIKKISISCSPSSLCVLTGLI